MQTRTGGFTLIELSIVLVIIGLVVGGILFGSDLVRAAEIRRTIAQAEKLDTAVQAFKIKYGCIPGDCSKASSLGFEASPFGMYVAQSQPPTGDNLWARFSLVAGAYAAPAPSAHSINLIDGDGDGTIENYPEYFNGIYELHQASLITGFDNRVTYELPLQMKAASAAGTQANWVIMYLTPAANASVPKNNHYLWASATAYEAATGTAVMTPRDAMAIDAKKDDALPRTGTVLATGRNDTDATLVSRGPFFNPATDVGTAGPTSNFCVTNAATPLYNVTNDSRRAGSLCSLTMQASF